MLQSHDDVLKLCFVAETLTLVLNWSVFHAIEGAFAQVPPELLGFAGTFLVFVCFAYPVRRLIIFRQPR